MKYKLNLLILIISLLILNSCSQKNNNKITIATAANMQFAMNEIIDEFTKETGVLCETVVSSSGKLTAQIKEGAPFDVFISADMKYPNNLYNSGFTTNKPAIYAYGKLILWTMKDDIDPTLNLLETSKITHIATANPKTAPYGIATEEVLNHYNLLEKVKTKLVYGESISQTNQFITSKAAEIGFTSKSVVLSPAVIGKGKWVEIDAAAYTPIAQGVTLLKNSTKNSEQAQKFYNFLFSKKGKNILTKFGYSVN